MTSWDCGAHFQLSHFFLGHGGVHLCVPVVLHLIVSAPVKRRLVVKPCSIPREQVQNSHGSFLGVVLY